LKKYGCNASRGELALQAASTPRPLCISAPHPVLPVFLWPAKVITRREKKFPKIFSILKFMVFLAC
jgi:hypothetical protein